MTTERRCINGIQLTQCQKEDQTLEDETVKLVVLIDSLHYARNLLNLLEFLAEAFRCHVHHFQCLKIMHMALKSFCYKLK
jgi:hypothetical protein